ncbi:hypothetical protein Patl1_01585 [Pistacia atlantica]|uniref:Uncharacterized protein n=1 Tax=Pistacia atlantica TaxID=434234 RepID=A0ACC1C9Y6_9ROSI|nr:hypothetical protein Patl1_01585 [Pistacia atlantica]
MLIVKEFRLVANAVTREIETVKGLKPEWVTRVSSPETTVLTPEQRRERDAKALQEKAARKATQAAGGGINAGGGGVKANKK